MSEDDRTYFYRRAEEETDHAQTATSPRLIALHYRFASAYLDRVFGAEGNPRAAYHRLIGTVAAFLFSRCVRRSSARVAPFDRPPDRHQVAVPLSGGASSKTSQ